MGETIVEARHLSHRYATQWAIQDINFEISQRGILGLLGSNGAGKSTTMNIICGVLNQTEGEVFINVSFLHIHIILSPACPLPVVSHYFDLMHFEQKLFYLIWLVSS